MPSPIDPGVPTARERLLDAALEVAAMHGISRLSVADVAKRAGLSRQTLYKHVSSREELIAQTVLREAGRVVERVVAAADAEADPARSLEAAIVTALEAVRDHPLLDRLLATEPEALLPLLTEGSGSVLDAVDGIARHMLEGRLPGLDPRQVEAGADLLSRMLVSYAVRPPARSPEAIAQSLSAAVLATVTARPDQPCAAAPAQSPPRPSS